MAIWRQHLIIQRFVSGYTHTILNLSQIWIRTSQYGALYVLAGGRGNCLRLKIVQVTSRNSKFKQRKLDFSRPEVKMLDPGEVRRLVAEYVVEDELPLSTVESPAFQKLVSKIPAQSSYKVKTNL